MRAMESCSLGSFPKFTGMVPSSQKLSSSTVSRAAGMATFRASRHEKRGKAVRGCYHSATDMCATSKGSPMSHSGPWANTFATNLVSEPRRLTFTCMIDRYWFQIH